MELATRLQLMNWLVSQGLTGAAENDLIRGFCERCRAGGLDLSRGLVFIDTLHPIFEGRGFRWNDTETNESDTFEYGSTSEGPAAQNWRRSTFYHMLEHGHDELRIDLADCASLDFSLIDELAAKGHRHFLAFVHRFGEAGTLGQMDCVYSYWLTRRTGGFSEQGLSALRELVPVLGLAIKSGAQVEIARTLGRVYLGRDASEQVLRGRISRGVTERINAVLWFSDLRGSTAISENLTPDEIIPFLNDYAQAAIDAIHAAGGASFQAQHGFAQRPPRRRWPADHVGLCRAACRRGVLWQHRQRGPPRFHRCGAGGQRGQPHRVDVPFGRPRTAGLGGFLHRPGRSR